MLRKEISEIPVCRPETVLAYVWSGEEGWSRENSCAGDNRRNIKCPVLTAGRKDLILEIVIEYMDRYSRGDGGQEL